MDLIHAIIIQLSISCVTCHVDYCASSLCSHEKGTQHVACNADLQFNRRTCPPGAKEVYISSDLRQVILDTHNARRSDVAMGRVSKFPQASRMMKMTWDSDLEHMAGFNVRRCIVRYDVCRGTPKYAHTGQNVAISSSRRRQDDAQTIVNIIDRVWFAEYKDCPRKMVARFGLTLPRISDFTTMVHQNSSKIGCAISKFQRHGLFKTLFVCNYQYANVIGEEVFQAGVPCSECPDEMECSGRRSGLCVLN